jgi:hypothetical protein
VSLLDVILGQRLILISIVLAVLPLLVAVGLTVFPLVRRLAVSKPQRAGKPDLDEEAQAAEEPQEDFAPDLAQEDEVPQPQAQASPVGLLAGLQPQEDQAEEEESEEEEESSEQVPDALQNILASVFEDDGVAARYEVLLKGLGDVDISVLVATCDWVADQLRMVNAAASRSAVDGQGQPSVGIGAESLTQDNWGTVD